MAIKNRDALKSYFVKNAIPTEGNFADLIDSQLNQAPDGDGVFKPAGEPFSVVAAPGDQKRVLRLYSLPSAANPDWMISLNPAQDPANAAATSKPGFGITDGAGKLRLFIDPGGQVGVGTNSPQFALDVVGGVRASSGLVVGGSVGIGTQAPSHILHVRAVDAVGLFESSGPQAYLRFSTAEGFANRVEFCNRPGGRAAIWVGSAGDAFNVTKDGRVGVGTTTPGAALDVVANNTTASLGWYEAIRFSRPDHSAITHPGGKLLFGLHGNRNFYFADTNASRYVMQISAETGDVTVGVGRLEVAGGVRGREIGIGTTTYGATSRPYETIQMNPGHNLRVWYGTTERFIFHNSGIFQASALRGTPGDWNAIGADGTVMVDNVGYKSMMIVGSNQSQGKNRWVQLWDYLTVHGNVAIDGNIGTHGRDPTAGYPSGWGGGVHTWDVIADANGFAHGSWQNGAFDLAERFQNHEAGLEAGDVLAVDPQSPERLVKTRSAQQDDIVGVVSERPGFILGVQWEAPHAGVPLALAGRVPVKVNLEGGPIRIGDYLTSSSQPGIAMRTIRSGRVIGLAMQAFNGTSGAEGKVVVLVNPHWFGGR
jgi:hypothetical protein